MLIRVLGAVVVFLTGSSAFAAWTGPICFPTDTREVVVSVITGELSGDVTVTLQDDDGELSFTEIRDSTSIPNARDFVFTRAVGANNGIVRAILASGPYQRLAYEFEFRRDPAKSCKAHIRSR